MTAVVRLALSRPYTFVVMAILVMIFGALSIFRTQTDIFPNIGIPVISVVWGYTGLSPDDMTGRIVSPYERVLSTTVNDIQHIESQSFPGMGVVKIFFQPNVDINAAQAQVTSISQTILKQLPAGATPPIILVYNASSVPIIQLALSSDSLSQTQLFDLAMNFIRPQLTTVAGAQLPFPYGGATRQVQIDLDQSALRAHNLSATDIGNALALQNQINPVGTEKIGAYEFTVDLNDSPKAVADFNNLPVKVVNGTVVFMRDVAYVHDGSPPQTNVVELDGRKGVLMFRPQDRLRVHARHHRRHQGATPGNRSHAASRGQPDLRRGPVRLRQIVRRRGRARRIDCGHAHRIHDPRLSRQLALDPDHHGFDPACGAQFVDRAVPARPDHQRHDARRPCACGRHSGRRRDGHDREH